ncbi:MAG: carbohydrate kinase [Pseudomonadota bacterium]|nr:carbohydrate kinase [Pseudomonadota bacterium]
MYLSCGDSLFDVFADPETDVATIGLKGRVGGSPLNVALGLARLGHQSSFFTKLSSDIFGKRLTGFMDREAIGREFAIPTDRHTTLAIVSLSEAGSASYDFYIEGTADRSIEPEEVPASFPNELLGIHLASYSTVTEPTASALAKLAKQESGRRFISYDPNIRASIEPDLDLWRAKVRELVPLSTLVKASEEDLEQLYPGRAIDMVLSDWLDLGAEAAVVTRGEHGAVAALKNGLRAEAEGLPVAVVDTVGAGDTFQAALIAWLIENGRLSRDGLKTAGAAELNALLAFAIRAAAVTCSRLGADLPRRADLGLSAL